ncbi:hypothetical protein E2P63_01780 [Candidatus Bathyarchaeota archaeon]|nr:hypothetical protein E2P63_01780 [Candidatus Bathyarchaeota archaeon]
MYSKQKLALIIVTILTISTVSELIPFGLSTITNRPTLYFDNTTADPLMVNAGSYVNITTAGMTITGAQVWLWLSTQGGSEITTAEGDRSYAGPFLLSDVVDTVAAHTYIFDSNSIPAPFNIEGVTYTYVVGGGWINGSVPLLVQGSDVDYWIKIADVSHSDIIAGSEIGVSTNRIRFKAGFSATPLTGAPGTPVTVSGYAVTSTALYNVTQDGLPALGLLGSTTNDAVGWLWTGFSVTFNILDLKGKTGSATTEISSVTINIIQNDTATTVATFSFIQICREVYLPSSSFKAHEGDYSGGPPTLNTSTTYELMLEWFPYMGSADVYLNNTLLKNGISLNATGSASTSITVPPLQSGNYLFRVIDNSGVEYNFTVYVFMWTYIYLTPASGHVGDSFTVTGINFLPYIGQQATIYFENSIAPPYYIMLLNFTLTSSVWQQTLVVPQSWGGARQVELRNIDGTTVITLATIDVTMTLIYPEELFHNVTVDENTYLISTFSNSTVSDLAFSQAEARLSFTVEGLSGTSGFCDITIPSELMSGTFSLFKDDVALVENMDYIQSFNGTHYTFSLTYEHSTHTIEIFSTTVIPELTSIALLLMFIIATITIMTVVNRKTRSH